RMRAIRLEPTVDPDRLAVRAVVKTPSHAFELLGDPEGVRVSRVAPVGGAPFDVDPSFPALDLARFATLADMEAFLADTSHRMAAGPDPRPAAAAGALEVTPPPRNALTLSALAGVFGEEAILAPNAMVELVQEFQHGGTRYRFVASREMGTRFKGRLIGPNGDVWSNRFALSEFRGAREIVARALGLPGGGGAYAPEASPQGAQPDLVPHPGEIWAMNVVVEQGGPDEVRYVGTDIDGRPYGAARVLRRADFEAVFAQEGGAWRLLVQNDQVQAGSVIYRQLDRARQPMGAPRKMSAAILVANFVPEASAY
ncbi:MAG TPA: hypothetical protein VLT61_10750, partial [Anaeromyxobacteraceae bacterium]|nr:hypothetical protein [Anaeromyxobacteraceae bacterium]